MGFFERPILCLLTELFHTDDRYDCVCDFLTLINDYTLGLGEIGPEDPNFKIKTWALGFQ